MSDWSSDVCSSDLANGAHRTTWMARERIESYADHYVQSTERHPMEVLAGIVEKRGWGKRRIGVEMDNYYRSEEHTSELQSLMRISYAVFCLKKKNTQTQ